MIIRFDGYYAEGGVTGKKCSKAALRRKFSKLINKVPPEDIVAFFRRVYHFDEIETKYRGNLKCDFVIDLDTYSIYKPLYDEEVKDYFNRYGVKRFY